uniref:Ig-like domain-containing protein n=1 Tax=Oryctolagus cuniculus TaxID=9986 RepID=G1U8W8_RABIT
MLSASCSVTVVVLLITVRRTNGDSVTQTEGPVILSEGSSLTLNCNYQTSYQEFLFWYVQYLHQGPQLLLKSATENQRVEHQGFHATLVKKDSSFHLHKSSLQLSDSAVYYCALKNTVIGTRGGAEHKPRGVQLGLWVGNLGRVELGFPPKS